MTWDGVPVPYITAAELSDKAISVFISKAEKKGRLDSDLHQESKEELVGKLNLLSNGYLSNAAVLLFHDDPEKYIFGAYIKIGYFENDSEILYQDEIHGSIVEQVDKTVELLYHKYLRARISYEGIQRIERYPFPEEAIREALLNAIVHKDYSSGVPIQISVYDDKLYIANDGMLPDSWTMEDLLGKHNSKPHNPRIAHVFYLAGFIESWGRGVEKIFRSCEEDGLAEPVYTIHPRDLMIRFDAPADRVIHRNGTTNVPINVPINVSLNLSEMDKEILRLVIGNPAITMQQIADVMGIHRKTVSRHVQVMEEQKLVERVGSRKKGTWKVYINL